MRRNLPEGRVDVAIIGGGIAGLSAAWHLQQESKAKGIDLSYVLVEQSDRWGGKIFTEDAIAAGGEPFVVEAGPDSFITQKPWAYKLAHELGMADRLLPTNDELRRVFVLNKGRPTPLPEGVLLIVPTKLRPFILSPLLSPLGKLRMGMDLLIPPKKDGEDETLAQFIHRRLGAEALDKIAEPLMAGIYNAEAEKQSLLSTFPRFRDIETKHGSLIKGMVSARKARNSHNGSAAANGSKPASVFMSFKGGMRELVQELQGRLTGAGLLQTPVRAILAQPEGGYHVALEDGRRIIADTVVLAVPAYVAGKLISGTAPEAARLLNGIRYVSTGTVSVAYRRSDVSHPLNGFGLVIPRSEKRSINAITWTSTKFNHRAPQERVLLRVFFGGSRHPEIFEADDQTLLATVRQELKALLGIDATPLFHRIYRWPRGNPQYDVGHLQKVAAIETALPPGLYVTGSPYRGIGVPDCIHQGKQTAYTLIEQLDVDQRRAHQIDVERQEVQRPVRDLAQE